MNRRAFLASVTGLAATPTPQDGGAPPWSRPQSELPGSASRAPSDTPDFVTWLLGFSSRAIDAGLAPALVASALEGLAPEPSILSQDQHQPEFSRPISDYFAATVTASRIAGGREQGASNASWLDPAAARYGVPSEILLAIWGVESGYGRHQGDHDVVRAFATLAYEGRRGAWAESQLIAALRMIASGAATRGQLLGSWAGAMGQMQFTPEDYLAYAVDADGDGRRDVWRSAPDAVVSGANFLRRKTGWRVGESWAREVAVPTSGFDYASIEGPSQTPATWAAQGVRPADGVGFDAADLEASAQLLMPMGWTGPGFLAFENHRAIRGYNNSLSYALAVGVLADRIAGRAPLVQPWPADAPSSLAERKGAQAALARQGFDPGPIDGALGADSRRAARGWQASLGLPADGYLSHDLIVRLATSGAEPPAVPATSLSGAPATL